MKSFLSLALAAVLLLLAPAAMAADRGTVDEAKAMAVKAAEFLKANGSEKSFAVFQTKDGPFRDRDLYVTVQDTKGNMVSHGTNPGLIGKNMLELKDVDGKPFNREIQAVTDAGWVEFKWQNPVTKTVEPKKNYVIRVGEYLVAVGAYVN